MNSDTKFFKLLTYIKFQSKKKIKIFEQNFAIGIFSLFLGFVSGNLFGTFLTFFRNYAEWDGAIITTTIRATRIKKYYKL